jgi:hypothetical protein
VPNADMTRFSQLGQRSPTKLSTFDNQVRKPTIWSCTANGSRRPPARPSAPRHPPSAPHSRAPRARRPRHKPSTATRLTCCLTSRSNSKPCPPSRNASAA